MTSTPVMPALSNHWGGPASGKRTDSFTAMTTLCVTTSSVVAWPCAIIVMTSIGPAILYPHAMRAVNPCDFVITTTTPSTVHHMLRLAGTSHQGPTTVARVAMVVLLTVPKAWATLARMPTLSFMTVVAVSAPTTVAVRANNTMSPPPATPAAPGEAQAPRMAGLHFSSHRLTQVHRAVGDTQPFFRSHFRSQGKGIILVHLFELGHVVFIIFQEMVVFLIMIMLLIVSISIVVFPFRFESIHDIVFHAFFHIHL